VSGVIYDTGALIAGERHDLRLLALHRKLTRQGERPMVPAVVLAQAWRGKSQPTLARFLKSCQIIPDGELIARAAGVACAVSGTADVVDAIVVTTAIARAATIVTSDPGDLGRLVDALQAKVTLHAL
jgi:hypothetical protein